jgi:hypothetical protein
MPYQVETRSKAAKNISTGKWNLRRSERTNVCQRFVRVPSEHRPYAAVIRKPNRL